MLYSGCQPVNSSYHGLQPPKTRSSFLNPQHKRQNCGRATRSRYEHVPCDHHENELKDDGVVIIVKSLEDGHIDLKELDVSANIFLPIIICSRLFSQQLFLTCELSRVSFCSCK